MTEREKDMLIKALKRDVPSYYAQLQRRAQLKKQMLKQCVNLASSDNADYQIEINKIYNATQICLSDSELILLNYICLIRHKEQISKESLQSGDEEIQKWIKVIKKYVEDEFVFSLLKKQSLQLIDKYRTKQRVGRPLNSGKRVFTYNGKEYHTIQVCANEYGITKQGMHKRLRKLNII